MAEDNVLSDVGLTSGAEAGAGIVLSTRKLCKVYGKGDVLVHALRDVDLDLRAGEMAVLLGASGSGKSTLLNIIGGLDVASSGTVYYEQQNLADFTERQLTNYRRNHVGFVFQFYNLISSLTARENVALVTDLAASPMHTDEALELVGLKDRMDHFPAELSGGEQQRVAIARAIAKRPKILLCDEPTGALDAETGRLVLAVLDEVNRKTDTTTAIITHNAAIGRLGDTVIRMSSGQIVETVRNSERASIDEIQW
ncbi:MAG: ABC transporter ATP-binding protein [Pseudohongiellaceae bacterium]|nr:ABC transporter ATP-binding protein [Pseudohongiellaceae bacterium]